MTGAGKMLWFFLLVLILGLIFGWHFAAVVLILGLIGYVGFWLLMLFKQVTGNLASCFAANANNLTSCSLRRFAQKFRW
jgi:hypothetical protein